MSTVNSRYSGPLNCGHLDIAATYLGTDFKLHQDCTNLVSDLRSPRYSVLQPLLDTPISAIVFILHFWFVQGGGGGVILVCLLLSEPPKLLPQ